MQQELLARRGQVGNIGAKAPSGIEALTAPKVAPTEFPLGAEALEMNQKLKAAKDAQAVRNLRADEQAAEAARKAVTETADAAKEAQGLEAINAAKSANAVNRVIAPVNKAFAGAREVQAARNLDNVADQISFPSETKTDAVTPPYRPNETQELLKKYPALTSVTTPKGSDAGPSGPSGVAGSTSPLAQIADLNQGVGRRDAGGNLSPKAETAIANAAKDAVPKTEDNSSWSKDDWVQFGLALLAGKSSNALTNVGEAGLSMIASKQARELKNRELDLYKQVHMEKPGEREKAVQKLMDADPSLTYEQALAKYASLTTAISDREKGIKQIMDERKVPYSKALEMYTDLVESPYKMAAVEARLAAVAATQGNVQAKIGESQSEAAARIAQNNLKEFYTAKKSLDQDYPSALRTGSGPSAKAKQAAYEKELQDLRVAFNQAPATAAPTVGPLVKVTGVKP